MLHIISGLGAGGAERMLTRLVTDGIGPNAQQLVVSLTNAGVYGAELEAAGVPLHCLGMKPGTVSLPAFWKLGRLLRSESPDIVQTWMYHADLAGLLAVKTWSGSARLLWNVRCTAMGPGYHSALTKTVIKVLALLSGMPDAVVVNSERGIQDHKQLGYRPRRWIKIPNGFDVDSLQRDRAAGAVIRRGLDIPDDATVFGMIARFNPMKNHAGFIAAASILAERSPKPHFILAGDSVTGNNPVFAEAMRIPSLKGRLHCLGLRRDIPALLSAIDGLVMCSSFGEGFSNVIGEAMSCSVPCIVTDVGEAAEVVGDTGFVVKPNGVLPLVNEMERFISLDADQKVELGNAARRRILESFSIDTVSRLYLDLYESACDKGRRVSKRSELEVS